MADSQSKGYKYGAKDPSACALLLPLRVHRVYLKALEVSVNPKVNRYAQPLGLSSWA